ncbi:MAG TPA: O-antigen ligase family protein [Euzebya sp.]|nr:O-antigen ligase family protein [Euzebya sp.]
MPSDATRPLRESLVLAVVPLAAVAFYRTGVDVYAPVKFLIVTTVAAALVGTVVRDVLRGRRPRRWRGPTPAVLVAFAVTLVLVWLVNEGRGYGLFGFRGRHLGLATYLSMVVLAVAAAASPSARFGRRLLGSIALAGCGVALAALAQLAGILDLPTAAGRLGATFGNSNFAAAVLGLGAVAALGGAVGARRVPRIAWTFGAVALAGVSVPTGADQGFLAIAAGLVVLAAGILVDRPDPWRRRGLAALAAVVVVAGVVAAAGLAGTGPARGLGTPGTVARVVFWQVGLQMVADRPLTGVGLDRVGVVSRQYLPAAYAGDFPLHRVIDQAHSVPVQMAATGGIPLALAYLALVGVTGAAFLRTLGRVPPDERRQVLGVGAVWAAYHAVALVSIDLLPLPAIHFVTAGWLLARGYPTVPVGTADTGRSPGGRPGGGTKRDDDRARQRRRDAQVATRMATSPAAGGLALVGSVVVVLLALLVGVQASRPLRAEAAFLKSQQLLQAGQVMQGVAWARSATELLPWEPEPLVAAGVQVQASRRYDEAFTLYVQADELAGGYFPAALNAARVSSVDDQPERAAEWYERALVLEPLHPDLRAEVGRLHLVLGNVDRARAEAEAALTTDPDNVQARELLARIEGTG